MQRRLSNPSLEDFLLQLAEDSATETLENLEIPYIGPQSLVAPIKSNYFPERETQIGPLVELNQNMTPTIAPPPVPPQVLHLAEPRLYHTSEHTISSVTGALFPELLTPTAWPGSRFVLFQPAPAPEPQEPSLVRSKRPREPVADTLALTDAEYNSIKHLLPKLTSESPEEQRAFLDAALWALKNNNAFHDPAFNHLPAKFGVSPGRISHEKFNRWVTKGIILNVLETLDRADIKQYYPHFLADQKARQKKRYLSANKP